MVSINGTDSRQISIDLLLPVGVAVVLVLVHLLVPLRMRSSMAFSPSWFSFYSLLTAPYVHADAVHLLENLVLFLVTASLTYLLTLCLGYRRWFHTTAVGLLIGLPIVHNLSVYAIATSLALDESAGQFGFSSVGAGFAAFLLVALLVYIDEGYGRSGVTALLAFLAIVAGLVMGVSVLTPVSTVLVGTGLTGVLVAAGWYQCRQAKILRRQARRESPIPTDATVLAVAVFVFALEFFSLFQVGLNPVAVVLGHVIPFGIGIVVSLLAYRIVRDGSESGTHS